MKRVLPFLLLLTLLPISLAPPALAFHGPWAGVTIDTFDLHDPASAVETHPMRSVVVGSTIHVTFWQDELEGASGAGFDWRHASSSDNGATWSAAHTVSTIGGPAQHDLAHISGTGSSTVLGVCYFDNASDLFYVSSTNAGVLWTEPSTVATTSDSTHDTCVVASYNSGAKIVVYYATATDNVYKASTDGGSSWGAETIWDAAQLVTGPSASYDQLKVAVRNETQAALFWRHAGGALGACMTNDAGVTFDCELVGSQLGHADSGLSIRHITGNRYDIAFHDTSGNLRWCTTGDPAIQVWTQNMWQCSTALTLAGIGDVELAVDPEDHDRVGLTWTMVADGTTPVRYAQTDDLGNSWSAAEAVKTYSVSLGPRMVETEVLPNGKLGVFYHECQTVASADIDCAAAGAEFALTRIYTAEFGEITAVVTATADVTNLNGFDVDPTGTRAVGRTNNGDCVEIWGAKTLGNHGACPTTGSVQTNCAIADGVAAKEGGQLVFFVNCDGDGDIQFLSIRDNAGGVPSAAEFSDCTPGSAEGQCPYDITITEPGWGEFDDGGQLGQVKDYPVDYSSRLDNSHLMAFAFSTAGADPGEVGIAVFVRRQAAQDGNEEETVPYSTTEADDFCIGLDNGQYYLAAADGSEPVTTYPVTFEEETVPQSDLNVEIGGSKAFGVTGAEAVDCGGGQVAFVKGGTLYYSTRDGAILDTHAFGSGAQRGVAISGEYYLNGTACFTATTDAACKQHILVWENGGDDVIVLRFNVTSHEIEALDTVDITTDGSFVELEIDTKANGAWVAQSGQIDYIDITNITNGGVAVPSECLFNCEGEPEEEEEGEGILNLGGEPIGAALGNALGVGEFGGNLLAATVTIIGVTVTGATALGGIVAFRSLPLLVIGAMIGLVGGFLLSWGLGYLNDAAVFATLVLGFIVVAVGGALLFKRG